MRESKHLVVASVLLAAAACTAGPEASAPELERGYLPARSVAPLVVRSVARTPVPPPALDPAELGPDQPENVVGADDPTR